MKICSFFIGVKNCSESLIEACMCPGIFCDAVYAAIINREQYRIQSNLMQLNIIPYTTHYYVIFQWYGVCVSIWILHVCVCMISIPTKKILDDKNILGQL